MSIEFSFINLDESKIGHRSLVEPGQTKTLLTMSGPISRPENYEGVKIVRQFQGVSREIKVYQGTCYDENDGGYFTEYYVEDRG